MPIVRPFLERYARLKPHISHGEAMLVIHLMYFKWDIQDPWPDYKTLARFMGFTGPKQVQRLASSLEEKGYLAHTIENRTFYYQPAESRQRVAGRAVQRIVDWFCEGSVEELLVGMVDSKVLGRAPVSRAARALLAKRT